jgi:hypothetical protein
MTFTCPGELSAEVLCICYLELSKSCERIDNYWEFLLFILFGFFKRFGFRIFYLLCWRFLGYGHDFLYHLVIYIGNYT